MDSSDSIMTLISYLGGKELATSDCLSESHDLTLKQLIRGGVHGSPLGPKMVKPICLSHLSHLRVALLT